MPLQAPISIPTSSKSTTAHSSQHHKSQHDKCKISKLDCYYLFNTTTAVSWPHSEISPRSLKLSAILRERTVNRVSSPLNSSHFIFLVYLHFICCILPLKTIEVTSSENKMGKSADKLVGKKIAVIGGSSGHETALFIQHAIHLSNAPIASDSAPPKSSSKPARTSPSSHHRKTGSRKPCND